MVVCLAGCVGYGKRTAKPHMLHAPMEAEYEEESYYAEAPMAAPAPKKARAASDSVSGMGRAEEGMVGGGAEPLPDAPTVKRMIAYEASTQLRVQRLRDALVQIEETTKSMGGFLESVRGTYVVVRVPVARFREGLAKLQALGDVLDERIFASDVTEAFQDIQLRLDVAEATRARLIELLAKTKDDKEKLQLLAEIQRLTDRIDQMTSQSTMLKRMADLSRITLQLVERQPLQQASAAQEMEPFAWIREIRPFGSDAVRDGDYVKLSVPEGMVGLDLKKAYVAEAPDGSRIWSGDITSEVEADKDFWASAVKSRLESDFADAKLVEFGAFAAVVFTSRDETPYTWIVAIRPRKKGLDIVEVYLSSPEQAERYRPAIEAVLLGDGGAA